MKAAPLQEEPRRKDLLSLLAKYDVAAPRYTSYPPATQFRDGYTGEGHIRHIQYVMGGSRRSEISLYLHIPFCDTLCYFCGCTMMVTSNREKIAEYLAYLKKEIALVAQTFEHGPTVVQMHWGGGSPTHLLPSEIKELGLYLRSVFQFAEDAEISVEVDPRGVTQEHIAALKAVGFNRASIGVQDFDEDVQIAINRIQSVSLTEEVIGWCREAGLSNINLDLIYGLPYQTTESFSRTLEIVRRISPDRIAVYNFAYVPWIKPHQKLIEIQTLPAASSKLALLELAIHDLTDAGYVYLGMDHFAKPDDSLVDAQQSGTLQRNFQGYSTFAGKDLYSFGISAIGRVENTFAQNVKELPAYYSALDANRLPINKGYCLSADDEIRGYVIMQLMCNFTVDKHQVEHLFGVYFDRYFDQALQALEELEADGLCELHKGRIDVTDVGHYFLRNVAACFDEYLPAASATQQFSRTV